MGTVIVFVNQKGGCSKTTTSVHFVRWLELREKRVCLIDSDSQESAGSWLESLAESWVQCVNAKDADEILDKVPDLAEEFDYLVIDSPGNASESIRAAMMIADVAIIPCQPTGLDLDSTNASLRLIQQAMRIRKGLPKYAVFLAIATPNTKTEAESREMLEAAGVNLLKTAIHRRQVVSDTFGLCSTVFDLQKGSELDPATKAAKEFESLFEEIIELCQQD